MLYVFKRLLFFIAFTVSSLLVVVSAFGDEYIEYQLQPGEGVGEILKRYRLDPVWGEGGSLEKTIQLNQKLFQVYDQYTIPYGVIIRLPIRRSQNLNTIKPIEKVNKNQSFVKVNHPSKLIEKLEGININFFKGSIPENSKQPIVLNINVHNKPVDSGRGVGAEAAVEFVDTDYFIWSPKALGYEYEASLGGHSLKLDATNKSNGARAELLSDQASSLTFGSLQKWSVKKWSSFDIKIAQMNVLNASDETAVKGGSKTLLEFKFTYGRRLKNNLSIMCQLAQQEKYFVDSSTGALFVEAEKILSPKIGLLKEKLLKPQHRLITSSLFSYYLGSSYSSGDIDGGFGVELRLSYEYQLKKRHNLGASLSFDYIRQDTELYEQRQTEASIFLNYQFQLGGGKK